MLMKSLRLWHRWVGWIAALFLIWASITGVMVAAQEFWGPDEAERERLRDLTSAVKLDAADTTMPAALRRALATAAARAPGAPIDKVELKVKGDAPTVAFYLGKPGGGEDKILRFNANTGAFIAEEDYADKPLLYRLHSGEAFGDGGLVVAMFWGAALAVMAVTGGWMYLHMYNKHNQNQHPKGWRKFFW
jgi:uncharacterized iron-regulated membrane protein